MSDPPLSPPSPSNSEPFPFACACLNVSLAARLPKDIAARADAAEPSAFARGQTYPAWIEGDAEIIRQAEYATYESRDGVDSDNVDGNVDGPRWRKCWLCGVHVYRTNTVPPRDMWVEVDLTSGIVFGPALDRVTARPKLPFSDVVLDIPAISTFGRPPLSNTLNVYPTSQNPKGAKFLPPLADPFFLPPPFIPAHPHLRDMCKAAVVKLQEEHTRIEAEIQEYVARRAVDMYNLEDKVRAEVEVLWMRYIEGPGRDSETERRRSSSFSHSERPSVSVPEVFREIPSIPTDDIDLPSGVQGIPSAAASSTSLLSASISANAFYAPPPASHPAPADSDVFAALTKSVSHDTGLEREVAMSYMFSSMEHAAHVHGRGRDHSSGQRSHSRRQSETRPDQAEDEIEQETEHGLDSWIGMERADARARMAKDRKPIIERDEVDESATPRPRGADISLDEIDESKELVSKSKGRVTFEEPSDITPVVNGDADGDVVTDEEINTDEYVFDFELDGFPTAEAKKNEENAEYKVPQAPRRSIVEDNLSRTFAADAPSHRAAWRRIEENQSIYAVLRRGSSHTSTDDDDLANTDDSEDLSKLATSMPVNIVRPSTRLVTSNHRMEPKTSLSERTGILVPSLIGAMRERPGRPGRSENALGLGVPGPGGAAGGALAGRRGSRSASVSREREQVKSYAADPGAVFESLAEGAMDSDSDSEGSRGASADTSGQQSEQGTLRDSRTFVPPHVLARMEGAGKPEVGWRSLAS